MRPVRLFLFLVPLPLCLLLSAASQQIRFVPNFSAEPTTGRLQFNGSQLALYNSALILRLTQEQPPFPASTSAYFRIPQPVTQGFTTYFAFQMHNPTMCCAPGDGFAFILQNSNATDASQGAMGRGLTAVGSAMGGIGYSGINDSLAIEFDIFDNPWDPNPNHIAIQTCGGDPAKFNSPVHVPGDFTIGNNDHVTSCLLSQGAINNNLPSSLGPICNGDTCNDGPVHQVVIGYDPPSSGQQQGLLEVYLDPVFQPGTHTPIIGTVPTISVPYNIQYSPSNPLGLALANINQIYVGFTASEEDDVTTTDILEWEFTPHAPSQVSQEIPPGGVEADYPFGGHVFAVTYPSDFRNDNHLSMTVMATPVNQQLFYSQRLHGTQFADETCIIYLQTGGNCIDYSVTCQTQQGMQTTCPMEPDPSIAICSQFYTSLPVSQLNTDWLEAEPIGSNNWCSIWTFFNSGLPNDPIVGGGGTGFSDVVATLSPTGPGPSCSGSLEKIVEQMTKQTSPPPNQSHGFCPAIR